MIDSGPSDVWTDSALNRQALAIAPLVLTLIAPIGLLACSRTSKPPILVLANTAAPASVAIAEHYRARHGLPASRVLTLEIPPEPGGRFERISAGGFEVLIRGPVEGFLESSGLKDEIEIIVTTRGLPLIVEAAPVPAATLLRDGRRASVDAELSLLFSDRIGSAGVHGDLNPYFDAEVPFARWRRAHPDAPLRYLVARLTGKVADEAATGVPASIHRALDNAAAPPAERARWLVDEDPSLPPAMDAGNLVLLRPAAGTLRALGLRVEHDREPGFRANVSPIQGYASWGSNDGHDPGPPYYGQIDGQHYPGAFGPRALATDLVSTNARSFEPGAEYGQSLVADLIDLGAAGSAGHVDEPTMPAVAHPQILLQRYAEGVRAIEAYYRALPFLGWLNVYIGDPLMQLPAPVDSPRLIDRDDDGHPDPVDNCPRWPNSRQRDTDADGVGNLCDADVNGDGVVTTSYGEIYPLSARGDVEWIALTARNGPYDPDHDLDGDGEVDARDVSIAQMQLWRPVGAPR